MELLKQIATNQKVIIAQNKKVISLLSEKKEVKKKYKVDKEALITKLSKK